MRTQLRTYGPYVALALVAAVVLYLSVDPYSRNDSHWWRMVIAGFGVLAAGVLGGASYLGEKVRKPVLAGLRAVLVVVAVFGWFNYYEFNRDRFEGLGDSTDITYYYVNSKYLSELGYFGLYPAMIVADAEGRNRHSKHVKRYRDLRDYEVKGVDVALAHGREIKEQDFTPERWKQFQHDVDWFLARLSTRMMTKHFYVDHGYNPPPTWSVPGAFLANLAPVEHIKWIASVDLVLVAGMFCVVGWAFGFDGLLFAMVFFLCTFSGRWPMLGEALLRFDWLCALIVSMCLLKKERYGLAGLFLAYAGLNRIFPMIFFWGWGVVLLIDTWRERRLLPKHRNFMIGAGAMTVFLIGTALVQFGPDAFRTSARNLAMHNKSYSSHRVGLGDLLLFRGEKTRAEMAETTHPHGPDGKEIRGIQAKEYTIRDMQPLLRGAAVVALVYLTIYAVRRQRDPWELLPLAVLPFFCATNAQINYYNLRIVLILLHVWALGRTHEHRLWHLAGLALLFATELATQWAFLSEVEDPRKPGRMQRVERYYVTCTTSLWLGIYLAGTIVGLARDAWPRLFVDAAAPPPAEEVPAPV
jgi:hypothetical protein